MMTFKYTAMSTNGEKVKGVVEAVDEFAAVDQIRSTHPIVLKVEELKDKKENFLTKEINPKVDEKALSVMCSQFHTILNAGMDVASAMNMIGNQTEDKKLKKMLLSAAKDVQQGNSVALSMERNCTGLPVTFVETVKAGELSGTLEDSFKTLETYYSKNYKLKQKIKQAMTYPIFVLIIAIVVIMIVMVKVMPTMTAVFDDLGGELPAITKIMIAISNFFGKWWLLIVLIILGIILGLSLYHHTEKGKLSQHTLRLKLPVLGKINVFSSCADFANTMAALLQAGLPMTQALETTAKVLNNYVFSKHTEALVGKIEVGNKLGDSMRADDVFPTTLTEMVAVGENTGEMEETLKTIGEYYTNEANVAMEAAIAKLEPTILVFLALFAGFIVFAIYMPMFTMYDLM